MNTPNGKNLIPFEIHLTCKDDSIHKNAKKLGLKTIAVDLLSPSLTLLRTEHMTSHVEKFESILDCETYVLETVTALTELGSSIIRTKIECPFIEEFVDNSCYLESHWQTEDFNNQYPLSRSQHKTTTLATARTYSKKEYKEFSEKQWGEKQVVELCIFDSYVEEDFDWFELYSGWDK